MRPRFLLSFLPALVLAALPTTSSAGVYFGVSVNIAPPPLPVYVQPPCPEAGYLWSPGYWAWGPYGYYWVPGTWVLPPQVGLLWTPGWWGWSDGGYLWHGGYWGPRVGFYGGIDYGYGYDGDGFDGGYWHRGVFFYNRAVAHVGPTFVRNVYYREVPPRQFRHVSFNGGRGGIMARPSRDDMMAAREHHFGETSWQQRQVQMARGERAQRADYNHGRPGVAATTHPAEFRGHGVYGTRSAGGPMPEQQRVRAPQLRSDRPAWASGQERTSSQARESAQQQWRQPRQEQYRPAQQDNRNNWSAARDQRPQESWQRPQNNWSAPREQRPQQSWQRPQNNWSAPREQRPQQNWQRPQNHWSAPREQRPQQNWQRPQNHWSAPREQRQWGDQGGRRPEAQPQRREQPQRGGDHRR